MRNSIYHNATNDKQYKASTGLSKEDFLQLLAEFEKLYIPKSSHPYASTKPAVLTDAGEALFFILHYFKSYPTLQNLGLYFGFSEFTASQYIEYIKPVLKAALAQLIPLRLRVFRTQQDFDQAFEGIEELMIDVTELPIQRSVDNDVQKEHYSGKKNA